MVCDLTMKLRRMKRIINDVVFFIQQIYEKKQLQNKNYAILICSPPKLCGEGQSSDLTILLIKLNPLSA